MYTKWEDIAKVAIYATLRGTNGSRRKHPGLTDQQRYVAVLGMAGKVNNRDQVWALGGGRFSINTCTPPEGHPAGRYHQWCYPGLGDVVDFFDHNMVLIGTWDGTKVVATQEQRQTLSDTLFGREETKRMFKAGTAKAKGGHRAIVEFNNVVVWEGTEVYTDDANYVEGNYDDGTRSVGQSGLEKATKAAASAVEQAVEALFAKVKV